MTEISKKRRAEAEALIRRLIPHVKKCEWEHILMEGCDGFFELKLKKYKVIAEDGYFTIRDRYDDEILQLEDSEAGNDLWYELKRDEDLRALHVIEEVVKEVENG